MSDKGHCLHVWRGKLSLNWFNGKNTNHALKDFGFKLQL
jgi:hypothetical protein